MINQENNKINKDPNDSDNLQEIRALNQDNIQAGSQEPSSSTLDSLLSPSTLGIGSDGTGQNHSTRTVSDESSDKTPNQESGRVISINRKLKI